MITVAEHHAKVDEISREDMDEYAVISHKRAVDAIDAGRFKDEIAPVLLPGKRAVVFDTDEHPRRDATTDGLAALAPVRPGGVITAGNAAGINDGAAAAIVCSDAGLKRLSVEPLARIVDKGWAMAGCDPELMGYSCVAALDMALGAARMRIDELDLIECNEGFAVQLVACQRIGKWPSDRINVDGGSIALGHPVGMSGLRIVIHLAHALKQRDEAVGAATVPAGSGLGTAVVLERPEKRKGKLTGRTAETNNVMSDEELVEMTISDVAQSQSLRNEIEEASFLSV
jgi:acetyl-CoA acetyltransferase family protein